MAEQPVVISALVIREPWIDLILDGKKTWEMRSRSTRKRGWVGLIRQGSGTVVGVAKLTDSLPLLSPQNYSSKYDQHAIPESQVAGVIERGWVHPWVLEGARRLQHPVPYVHNNGAVLFVNLDRAVSEQIAAQMSDVSGLKERQAIFRQISRELQAHPKTQSTSLPIETAQAASGKDEYAFAPEQAHAVGYPTVGGFMVLKGSTAMREGSPRAKRDRPLRDQLVRTGVLEPADNPLLLRFSRNHEFGSASAAAGIVKDGNASGSNLWRHCETRRTLAEMEGRR